MEKIKKGKKQVEEDNTIIYMIVGFCLGVIITLIFFEYYWIGVGGGTGMLIGVISSIISDYINEKNTKKSGRKKANKKVK